MASAGEATTVKHFPGLGRATGNTDTTSHVTDPTTRHDPYLRPFAKAVQAGVPFVMVSSATYPRIDPSHKACFSHTVVTGMLRDDLRFDGVVISDDLTASPLDRIPAATRSVRWLRAGGDMLLVTDPGVIGPMTRAIRARAADHPAFAAAVKQAVLTVLRAKAAAGLVGR
jgi:beta-N-acetylhexosaminidase